MNQAGTLRVMAHSSQQYNPTRVLAVTSGKGGVGKTNVVANMAHALARLHKKVMVMDANPEPTAITDAYALMKILAHEHDDRKFQLIVNWAASAKEAQVVFQKLKRATQQFLDFSIDLLGWIPYDTHVQKAVRQQKTVVESYPNAQASRAFLRLAMAICALPTTILPSDQIPFFWQRLFR